MVDSVRDLAAWYPLIPAAGMDKPGWVDKVLDMRVAVCFPASESISNTGNVNRDILKAKLSSISSSTAEVSIESCFSALLPSTTSSVPVYIGRDSCPSSLSYMIVSEELDVSDSDIEIHPDCYLILQKAPRLRFIAREQVSPDDGTEDSDTSTYSNPFTVASFSSGNNIEVGMLNDTLVFNCSEGYGKGRYTTPPYRDLEKYKARVSRGLRSINGFNGNVQINGSLSVEVKTEAVDSNVVLTIKAKKIRSD